MDNKNAHLTKYEWGQIHHPHLFVDFFFSGLGQPTKPYRVKKKKKIKGEPNSKPSNEIHDSFTTRDPEINFHDDIK